MPHVSKFPLQSVLPKQHQGVCIDSKTVCDCRYIVLMLNKFNVEAQKAFIRASLSSSDISIYNICGKSG